ncbi:radical SAM protein [Diplocloster modestus]|uniref:radical SAM protein n=1 Tax=Diplocloster modestus TaxID=2850322 RepID=UPI001EE9529C|nr:radical SAM protein [Diplocloster modestus]
MQEFQLEEYLSRGVQNIVRGIILSSAGKSGERSFLMHYASDEKRARKLRAAAEQKGEHIPPFLIASITRRCNLSCKGCYARANNACADMADAAGFADELTGSQWGDIFTQAEKLGVSFVLLAGGEPMARGDVLEEAGRHKKILFPVFTNGTMFDSGKAEIFLRNRNLIPIISMEGDREETDRRRGEGVYGQLLKAMELLKQERRLFGASVTVTSENLREVASAEFVHNMKTSGCGGIVFVEYVPADKRSRHLCLDAKERDTLARTLEQLRRDGEQMLLLSFPGDEKEAGGCLAAGRGFFHINAAGQAEPCPFSPYSDTSLLHTGLREALRSPLFLKLKDEGILKKTHTGGCVLFEQEESVKKCLEESGNDDERTDCGRSSDPIFHTGIPGHQCENYCG